MSKVIIRIRRQDGPRGPARWESFSVSRVEVVTIADALQAIEQKPGTVPVAWSSGCTWPSCGVCTMSINGRAAPACGTTLDSVLKKRSQRVDLAPLSGFEVVRDLVVDRARMRHDAARVLAHAVDLPVPAPAATTSFARCTRCGACVDACPEARVGGPFVGPYALGAVHATQLARGAPLPLSLLGPGGIADCGHVENCVEVCPEAIPLNEAVGTASRKALARWVTSLFGRAAGAEQSQVMRSQVERDRDGEEADEDAAIVPTSEEKETNREEKKGAKKKRKRKRKAKEKA